MLETERLLDEADLTYGRAWLELLALAIQHLRDAGSVSYARALERIIASESRAALEML